jgi:hypothetical protein
MRRILFVIASGILGVGLLAVSPAVAAKPHASPVATCSVSSTSVDATGLPTDQVVNFFVTDNSGTNGWVLGTTDTGTWTVDVSALLASRGISAVSGPATYQFTSRTWGPNGAKFTVFASC